MESRVVLTAAEQGNDHAIRAFLEEGKADVCDEEGFTPLMCASANGQDSTIRILLQRSDKAKVDAQNVYGWTSLMQAACYGHLSAVMLLLQNKADVNLRNCWGTGALVAAAQGGFTTVAKMLLKEGAEVNKKESVSVLTPLLAAAQFGSTSIVQELVVTHGASINARLEPIGWTALMLAALNNQVGAVETLLQNRADKTITDINNRTAADIATALGHSDVVLLLAGGKPKKQFSENSFFEAVKQGNLTKVKEALERSKKLPYVRDKDGATPLMFAANKGHIEICKLLCKVGSEVNAQDNRHGWTALMHATHQRRYAVVKLLAELGADVRKKDKNGSGPFDVADLIGDVKMINLIAGLAVVSVKQRRAASVAKGEKKPTMESILESEPGTEVEVPETVLETEGEKDTWEPPHEAVEGEEEKKEGEEGGEGGEKVGKEDGEEGEKKEGKEEVREGEKEGGGEESKLMDPSLLIKHLQSAYRLPEKPSAKMVMAEETSSVPSSEQAMAREVGSPKRFPEARVQRQSSAPASPNTSYDKPEDAKSGNDSMPVRTPVMGPMGKPLPPGLQRPNLPRPEGMPRRPNWLSAAAGNARSTAPMGTSPHVVGGASGRNLMNRGSPVATSGGKSPGRRQDRPSLLKYGNTSKSPGSKFGAVSSAARPQSSRPFAAYGRSSEQQQTPSPFGGRPRLPFDQMNAGPSGKKRPPSLVKNEPAPDLKTVLENASLGQYFPVFEEQEMDYDTFVTLSSANLEELGISDLEERDKILTFIGEQSQNSVSSSKDSVFMFH